MNIKEKRDLLNKLKTDFLLDEIKFLDNLWETVDGFYLECEYRNKCVYYDVLTSPRGIKQIISNINEYFKKSKNIDNIMECIVDEDSFIMFLKYQNHMRYLLENGYVQYRGLKEGCLGCSA